MVFQFMVLGGKVFNVNAESEAPLDKDKAKAINYHLENLSKKAAYKLVSHSNASLNPCLALCKQPV